MIGNQRGNALLYIIIAVVIVFVGISAYFFIQSSKKPQTASPPKQSGYQNPSQNKQPARNSNQLPNPNQEGPWKRTMYVRESSDGSTSGSAKVFVKAADVPSAIIDKNGKIIVAFQWFPFDDPISFGKVAIMTSTDQGKTWSEPTVINIAGLPAGFQKPFDPTLLLLPDGRIRLYFTSGKEGQKPKPGSNPVDQMLTQIYSAVSEDGINFKFEEGQRLAVSGKKVVDSAAVIFNNIYHLTAPAGAPQEGAFHATSSDGLNFSKRSNVPSTIDVNWTGNLVNTGSEVRFYGWNRNKGLWFSSSIDVTTWSAVTYLNIVGKDPAVVKTSNKYLIIYPDIPPSQESPPQNKP